MDRDLDRIALTPGASVYPFCWSILLAARQRGLGGVMTTFLSRVEPAAAPELGLPDHHALAATIFLGVPETTRDASCAATRSSRSRRSTASTARRSRRSASIRAGIVATRGTDPAQIGRW